MHLLTFQLLTCWSNDLSDLRKLLTSLANWFVDHWSVFLVIFRSVFLSLLRNVPIMKNLKRLCTQFLDNLWGNGCSKCRARSISPLYGSCCLEGDWYQLLLLLQPVHCGLLCVFVGSAGLPWFVENWLCLHPSSEQSLYMHLEEDVNYSDWTVSTQNDSR